MEVNEGGGYGGYMHNKFIIFDDETVFTGSWNFTILQEALDFSYVFVSSDDEIVKPYVDEFSRLFKKVNSKKKFGDDFFKPFYKLIRFKDCFLEIWFSPGVGKNSVEQRIVDLVNSADKSLYIGIWEWTDFRVFSAVKKKALDGVKVFVLIDDYNEFLRDSVFFKNKGELNIPNFVVKNDSAIGTFSLVDNVLVKDVDGGLNSFFHHHFIVVDDKVVVFGTGNFSDKGFFKNDENFIVTDNKDIVRRFSEFFQSKFVEY